MEESQNQTDEKLATHKKKIQAYMLVAVGLIMIALFILTVINIFTNTGKDNTELFDESFKEKRSNLEQQKKINNSNRASFDQLINTDERSDYSKNSTEPDYIKNPHNEIAAKVANQAIENLNPYSSRGGYAQPKVEKTQEERWREQEELRALNSARAKWVINQKTNNSSQNNNASHNDNVLILKDIEAKRQQNRARIEDLERTRQQMQYNLEKGNTREVEKLALNIDRKEQSFNEPPVDIVGYTKENAYQADIEGKLKIPVGTVIPAVTSMRSVSDYMGTFKAMIDYDIYDATYTHILIPKGTEFMIKPVRGGVNEILQTRMGYTVTWAVLPNGNKIDFSKSSGLDRDGIGAIKGDVDYHFFSQFFGVAAYALVSSESSRGSSSANDQTTFAGDIGDGLRQQARPLVQKYINVVPTITIENGTPIRIIIEDEIYVDSWKEVYSDYY